MPRPSPSSPRAAASARYAAVLTEERQREIMIVAGVGLAVGAVIWLLAGWRIGVPAGLWAAGIVLLLQWRGGRAESREGMEREMSRELRPLAERGYVVLPDRLPPDGRGRLDHLVIGPTGVVLVDSKGWGRKRLITGLGGQVRIGRISGRTATATARTEAAKVYHALAAELGHEVPVDAVLAVHRTWMPSWRNPTVEGIPLLRSGDVARWISDRPAELDGPDVAQIAAAADRIFPPADGPPAPPAPPPAVPRTGPGRHEAATPPPPDTGQPAATEPAPLEAGPPPEPDLLPEPGGDPRDTAPDLPALPPDLPPGLPPTDVRVAGAPLRGPGATAGPRHSAGPLEDPLAPPPDEPPAAIGRHGFPADPGQPDESGPQEHWTSLPAGPLDPPGTGADPLVPYVPDPDLPPDVLDSSVQPPDPGLSDTASAFLALDPLAGPGHAFDADLTGGSAMPPLDPTGPASEWPPVPTTSWDLGRDDLDAGLGPEPGAGALGGGIGAEHGGVADAGGDALTDAVGDNIVSFPPGGRDGDRRPAEDDERPHGRHGRGSDSGYGISAESEHETWPDGPDAGRGAFDGHPVLPYRSTDLGYDPLADPLTDRPAPPGEDPLGPGADPLDLSGGLLGDPAAFGRSDGTHAGSDAFGLGGGSPTTGNGPDAAADDDPDDYEPYEDLYADRHEQRGPADDPDGDRPGG